MFPQGVAHQSGPVPLSALRGLVGGVQQLFIQYDLNDLHMWNLFHSILHIKDISKAGGPFKPGFGLSGAVERWTPPLPFSSHFSRTAITDLHHNRCQDSSTVHHREVPPVSRDERISGFEFSPLFLNLWHQPAHPQKHAKQQNLPLSPMF
jgi:hypothetical protein